MIHSKLLIQVARDKAVKEAIESGDVDENDVDSIMKIRRKVPKVTSKSVVILHTNSIILRTGRCIHGLSLQQ